VAIAIAIAVIVVIVLLLRRAAGPSESAFVEDDLLQLCSGDKSQMERLIALERKNAPGISRSVAITRAAYSLRRDKR
jgi:hypothetical protein